MTMTATQKDFVESLVYKLPSQIFDMALDAMRAYEAGETYKGIKVGVKMEHWISTYDNMPDKSGIQVCLAGAFLLRYVQDHTLQPQWELLPNTLKAAGLPEGTPEHEALAYIMLMLNEMSTGDLEAARIYFLDMRGLFIENPIQNPKWGLKMFPLKVVPYMLAKQQWWSGMAQAKNQLKQRNL